MSILLQLIGRLFAARSAAAPPSPDPDSMSLRDWADLPSHHPSGDRAPC